MSVKDNHRVPWTIQVFPEEDPDEQNMQGKIIPHFFLVSAVLSTRILPYLRRRLGTWLLRETSALPPNHLDPTSLFPRSVQVTLLRAYLHNVRWTPVPRQHRVALKFSILNRLANVSALCSMQMRPSSGALPSPAPAGGGFSLELNGSCLEMATLGDN